MFLIDSVAQLAAVMDTVCASATAVYQFEEMIVMCHCCQ